MRKTILATVLATATLLPAARAAETTGQRAADRDFGKLSVQGAVALRKVREARLDIFNGHIEAARRSVNEADTALQAAKKDNTAFMRAESDLKAPAGISQPQGKSLPSGSIDWLPVDGAMVLDEDYKASQKKSDSVAKANAQIKNGDKAGAIETLRLADVGVSFTLAVVPLEASISDIQRAEQDINSGRYYEANQDLKSVEDGMRFDTETATAPMTAKMKAH